MTFSRRAEQLLPGRFRRTFLLRLLAVAGLPASGALAVNCGGIAVIDDAGAGGSTSSTASSNSASASVSGSSSSSGGFSCEVPVPEQGSLAYSCMPAPAEGCLPATDYQVFNHFWDNFAQECVDPDSCWCFGDACGCFIQPIEVPCGPEVVAGECCYYAVMHPEADFCEGRPFTVDGAAQVAAACERDDWLGPRSADEVQRALGLDAAQRQQLARHWQRAALNEHASVASFARFVMELLAVGAPAELVSAAQQAIGDEIDHAQRCFALASRYAGKPLGPAELQAAGAVSARADLAEIAVAVAEEGCVNETLAALCAKAALEQASEPQVRATLEVIADDELRHSELAWRFVAWACRRDETVRAQVAAAFERSVAALQLQLDKPPTRSTGHAAALLAEHGLLSEPLRAEVMRAAIRDVIVPCAHELAQAGSGSAERQPAIVARRPASMT